MAIDVMIVGSQKCGTSSLLAYLARHAAIQARVAGEVTWFADEEARDGAFPEAQYFGSPASGRLRLAKHAGLMYHEEGLVRLARHNPAVEAIAIVREPVARAYSAFWFARRRGRETRPTFEAAIGIGLAPTGEPQGPCASNYLEWSRYERSIRRLAEIVGRDQVHVLVLEEFIEDPRASTGPIFDRLGLDPGALDESAPSANQVGAARSEWLARAWRATRRGVKGSAIERLVPMRARDALRHQYGRLNETGFRPPPMDPTTERRLRELFEEPNRQLEVFLGRPIPAWQAQR